MNAPALTRLFPVAGALAAGAAVAAPLYWALLNTPDSNVAMLVLSGVLAVATLAVIAVSVNAAVLLAAGAARRAALRRAVGGVGWFLAAAIVLVGGWFAVRAADGWIEAHAGEINAWFIATLNWADISLLFSGWHWLSVWIRWAVLPMAALTLLAAFLVAAPRHDAPAPPRAPRSWVVRFAATIVFVLLLALAWHLTAWRPGVPATWLQPAAAAARLGVALMIALAGAALMVQMSVWQRHAPQEASADER